MRTAGFVLIAAGAVLLVLGLLTLGASKLPFFGRLPGDIHHTGRQLRLFFPVTSCIVLSIVLTLVVNLVIRLFR